MYADIARATDTAATTDTDTDTDTEPCLEQAPGNSAFGSSAFGGTRGAAAAHQAPGPSSGASITNW
ncbi:hypothetical protein [Catenulispora rubra]|uniref:hypothetical protein n=1 Tax=Catenulispora rubra TaxID=280293 RepID=UPI0018924038|nr:hypothetical protein [Catenulispora rubra]